MAWWNRVLSAGEIAALAAGVSPMFSPVDMVLYTPMIRETTDYIGGTAGTLDGTSVAVHQRVIYTNPFVVGLPVSAAAGRTTYNTDPQEHGINVGISLRMNG